MPRYRITITGQGREAMLALVSKHKIDVSDHGVQVLDHDVYSVDAIVDGDQIGRLQQAGYRIERHEDVDEAGKARQAEVGRGDRYEPPKE